MSEAVALKSCEEGEAVSGHFVDGNRTGATVRHRRLNGCAPKIGPTFRHIRNHVVNIAQDVLVRLPENLSHGPAVGRGAAEVGFDVTLDDGEVGQSAKDKDAEKTGRKITGTRPQVGGLEEVRKTGAA